MALSLTPRQADALRYIQFCLEKYRIAPTVDELRIGLGLASKNGAHRLLTGLEERGHIRALPARARAIEVLQPIAIPRAPDGAPLRFIPAPEIAA